MSSTDISNSRLVAEGYAAFAAGDMETLGRVFAPDAVWTHHNGGRFEGPKRGFETIAQFFGESVELTAGTLRVELEGLVGEGEHVVARVHMTASRPDGRSLDDRQLHHFTLRDGRAATIDQYIGDPAAVEAFWA